MTPHPDKYMSVSPFNLTYELKIFLLYSNYTLWCPEIPIVPLHKINCIRTDF